MEQHCLYVPVYIICIALCHYTRCYQLTSSGNMFNSTPHPLKISIWACTLVFFSGNGYASCFFDTSIQICFRTCFRIIPGVVFIFPLFCILLTSRTDYCRTICCFMLVSSILSSCHTEPTSILSPCHTAPSSISHLCHTEPINSTRQIPQKQRPQTLDLS